MVSLEDISINLEELIEEPKKQKKFNIWKEILTFAVINAIVFVGGMIAINLPTYSKIWNTLLAQQHNISTIADEQT